MTKLMIIGAGGFAKEVYSWILGSGYVVAAFYEHPRPDGLKRSIFMTPVVNDLTPYYGMDFIVAVGDPRARERLYGQAIGAGLVPCSPISHKTVTVGANVSADVGTIICPNVTITADVHIGKGCIINLSSTIGHDCQLGDFITISPGVNVSGNVIIQNYAYIGTNAAIREGKLISEGAIVGMGSVVVKDVEPHCTVFGNPAKIPVLAPRVINFSKEPQG